MLIGPMAYFGFTHLSNANEMASMVPDFLPMSVLCVYLTGMGLVLASIAIIIGRKARLASICLGGMLVLFALMVHLPSAMLGDDKALFSFFQNFALAGASLYLSTHLTND